MHPDLSLCVCSFIQTTFHENKKHKQENGKLSSCWNKKFKLKFMMKVAFGFTAASKQASKQASKRGEMEGERDF